MKRNIYILIVPIVLLFCMADISLGWSLQEGRLMTRWAYEVDPQNTLPEYPRPQMVRNDWMNLNGVWEMQFGDEGDPVPAGQTLSGDILVPFPVESAISGVMHHNDRLWYRREFQVPSEWDDQRVLLHFGAVDWESGVYVNGNSVGVHKGGYDPFSFDVTPYLNSTGPQELIVRVFDPTDDGGYARGKQTLYPGGIMYTPCTGIWQTVWLEPVPQISIEELKLVPDIDRELLKVTGFVSQTVPGLTVEATAYDNGTVAGSVSGAANDELSLTMNNPKLWSPDNPFLYDLTVVLKQGDTVIDQVDSYFGMRKISVEEVDGTNRLMLNNEYVFQMGPLDQGYWPDGIYTAPTDDALRYDLEMTKAFGFNMTRKHIKVEPARWYYWADKLGLMVWQDMPSVNSYTGNPQPIDRAQFKTELQRMVQSYHNHPSIIMWVIFNEYQGMHDTKQLCEMVKSMDPSRLVNSNSGDNSNHDHTIGDVFDIHNYPPPAVPHSDIQATACGEYGGIGMAVTGHMYDENSSWGYGSNVQSGEELAARYDSYTQMLASFNTNDGLSAAVYTQITDVEIEVNGLMTYDRAVIKADPDLIKVSNKQYTRTYEDILPTSQQTPQSWRYTTSAPANDWYTTAFDDSGWNEGPGGFGTSMTPGAVVGTEWSTSDIWLRRNFEVGTLTAEDMEKLVWRIHHDEDVEVYINGVLAFSAAGYTTTYMPLQVSETAKSALIENGINTIAVHCHQTGGGQYIDVGMALETVVIPEDNCGAWGFSPADLNKDCSVDLEDMTIFAADWMECSMPDQVGCINHVNP
ncbi:Evolved beta-galactosidase subunit alpha [Anaerohalosphaera lusitana]|uniref:Evolved beta-galactosidase subunit alpha n=1 Tax=Anaerohalosphaera lusitana TaxID=1936003 RepID=A0A1U9NNB5_9BACT|nr:sugar-binding domain-containing protein [Anaerohalosphaera lusitana]AQT69110.1 Evolved beta-galactosidase subunit alpha [Anaerohalosphaera lusitana]